jgi:hypothetical protein
MLLLTVLLHRDIRNHILVTYFPSALFVSVSWGSFLVSPEVVPGRMVLLVTTLLTLVTMLNTVRCGVPTNEPQSAVPYKYASRAAFAMVLQVLAPEIPTENYNVLEPKSVN